MKYCKCGAVVNESYSEFINFYKWTCDCEITNGKKQKKLKEKMEQLLLKILIYFVVVAISIAIITTSPIFGRLIIVAIIVLWLIPTLVQKIAEIINYVDKE